jgi:hypothetical protein
MGFDCDSLYENEWADQERAKQGQSKSKDKRVHLQYLFLKIIELRELKKRTT